MTNQLLEIVSIYPEKRTWLAPALIVLDSTETQGKGPNISEYTSTGSYSPS